MTWNFNNVFVVTLFPFMQDFSSDDVISVILNDNLLNTNKLINITWPAYISGRYNSITLCHL